MLSKVLKGDGAKNTLPMAFHAAIPAVSELAPSAAAPGANGEGPDAEGKSVLRDKIRALEAGIDAAKREAFDAGCRQGEQNARAALAPVLERLNTSIAQVIDMRPDLRRRAEKDAVELSLQIARRVLHRELAIDGNALNALARVVFDRLARTESWQLTVHPQFADSIRGALPAGSANRVQIEADASCARGTLIVHYGEGVIDASVDSQLAEIDHGLTDRLARK